MQGQKYLSNFVAANPPLARIIATKRGLVCTPSILDIQ